MTNDRRCVLLQNVRRGGKHTRTIVSICPSFRGKYVGPLRCRVSRCKPKAVSGIVLMTSLSLSFWFRDLSVLFTSQTLSLSGGGRLERKKRNLSFLLTERTIRHVNPLHFFPPIIHPCLRYYFRLLFFFFLLLSSRAKSLWYKTKLARSSTRLSPLVVVLVRVFFLPSCTQGYAL